MNKCVVSIIVPVYNGEKHIKKCFDSILKQKYKDYEIIFIDDCSTDNSLKILEEIKNNSEQNITLIKNENNSGVSYSRNMGIKNAKGKYICFLDCDDTLDKKFLDILSSKKIDDYDIIMTGFNMIFEDKVELLSFGNNMDISNEDVLNIIRSILNNSNLKNINPSLFGFSCGKFYKREIIDGIEFDSKIHYREDTLFNIRALLKSNKILLLEDCNYNYLQNSNSASYRFFENYCDEVEYYIKNIFELLKNYQFKENIYVFGMYMYMSFLKHYAMHKSMPKSAQTQYIKMSFKCDLWKDIFTNVNLSMLPIHYKILCLMYKFKLVKGIKLLYNLNDRLKERK